MREHNNMTPPVKEGDEFDVMIESVGGKGDGVAKKDGFVLFIPKTSAGENVRVRVTKVLKSVGFAEKIGSAIGKKRSEVKVAKKPKEEHVQHFDPQEELDTEDF